MKMKLFKTIIEEHNGEQEYSHDILILAATQASAEKKADKIARSWFDDNDKKKDGDGYFHLGGLIYVESRGVCETTKEEWQEWMYQRCLMN